MTAESHQRADERDDDPSSILEFTRNKVDEGRVPSIIHVGLLVFTSKISIMVGKKSDVTATVVTFLKELISAGECMMPGVRIPPSKIDALHCRRKFVDHNIFVRSSPWCGPLSAV